MEGGRAACASSLLRLPPIAAGGGSTDHRWDSAPSSARRWTDPGKWDGGGEKMCVS